MSMPRLQVYDGSATKHKPFRFAEIEQRLTDCFLSNDDPPVTADIGPCEEDIAQARQSMEQAYRDHHRPLCQLVTCMLGSPMRRRVDAEDVVSEAFCSLHERVIEGRVRIDPNGNLWPLLARFTTNRVRKNVDWHTQLKRTPKKEEYLEDDALMSRSPTPDGIAARVDSLGIIVRRLPSKQVIVFLLKLMDFTEEEIAAILGSTRERVKSLRDASRRRLRDLRKGDRCVSGRTG